MALPRPVGSWSCVVLCFFLGETRITRASSAFLGTATDADEDEDEDDDEDDDDDDDEDEDDTDGDDEDAAAEGPLL